MIDRAPWGLVSLGFALVLVAWGTYLATIAREKVPVKPTGTLALLGFGSVMAIAGAAIGATQGRFGPVPLAVSTLGFGGFFFWLYGQRHVPRGNLQLEVGKKLLPFTAVDHRGQTFSTADLAGRRVLIKFFRGSW